MLRLGPHLLVRIVRIQICYLLDGFSFGLVLRVDNKVAVFREVRSRTTVSVKWCYRDAKIHTIFESVASSLLQLPVNK